jgi:general L-amino acid transport system permease protein
MRSAERTPAASPESPADPQPVPDRGIDWRSLGQDAATVLLAALLLYYLATTAAHNLAEQGIASGFGFLDQEAGFEIGEHWIPYDPSAPYYRALLVGLLNTVQLALVAIVLTTVLGTLLGIARVSRNWLASRLSAAYVELFRNIPLLLQIVFWIALMRQLPPPRQALAPLPGVFLTNRGIIHAVPAEDPAHLWMLLALAAGVALSVLLGYLSRRRREATGRPLPTLALSFGLVVVLPFATWLSFGAPSALDVPELHSFNFRGGATQSPEFVALLVGVVAYTSAFVAEVVRSGIQAVDAGQREAGRSLGLREGQIMARVVLPQALRVIVPPMTTQYVNIAKDSSLGVAIGYPELVSVGNTTMNQTGQTIEMLSIIFLVYLTLGYLLALFMNWYNRRLALWGER